MKDITKQLGQMLIERHGELRLSRKLGFIGHERSRTDTHVTVGYSYRYLRSAETVISQYVIPISDWENPELFVTIESYVNDGPGIHKRGSGFPWYHCLNWCMSVEGFFYEDAVDHICTKKEKEHWDNPPYPHDDREPDKWVIDLCNDLSDMSDSYDLYCDDECYL